MTNWSIVVSSPTGVAKVTYSNASPGGIANGISWEVEPSGNCLSGTFEGIPSQLNIAPRDLVQITVGANNKFFGFVSAMPNATSKRVGTYQLEGIKKLYFETLLEKFYYHPILNSGAYVGELVKHSYIVSALHAFRPGFINTTMVNNASTTTGNKPPIIAQDYSLGEIYDAIINSAADDETYHWGVNADKAFFVVKESAFPAIDFTNISRKRVELTQQNVDDTVTSVRFVFSVPEGYYHPQLNNIAYTVTEYSGPFVMERTNNDSFAPISYEYTDPEASVYGKWTKIVPLVLTDTWMRYVKWVDAAAMDVNVTLSNETPNYSYMWEDMRTQSGSATFANQLISISTPGTDTYIRSDVSIVGQRGLRLTLHAGSNTVNDNPTHTIRLKGHIGYYLRAGILTTNRPITWWTTEIMARNPLVTSDPYFHYSNYYPPKIESGTEPAYSWKDTKLIALFGEPSMTDWQEDLTATNDLGFKKGDWRAVKQTIWLPQQTPDGGSYSSLIPAGDFRVYEWYCLFLNTEALDGFAKTLVQTPEDYPSEIMLQEDLGTSFHAVIDSVENIEARIVKVSYEISSTKGFVVKYTTGRDPDRSNQFIRRLMARDNTARNQATLISQTRL